MPPTSQPDILKKILKRFEKLSSDGISVQNLDEIKLHLRTEISRLSKDIAKAIPVQEPPQVILLNAPGEMKVIPKNAAIIEGLLKQILDKELKITVDAPDVIIPPIQMPKIEVPRVNVPETKVTVNAPDVNIDISEIVEALEPLGLLSRSADKPISVRLSDGQKFIKALNKATAAAKEQIVSWTQNPGVTEDEFKAIIGTPKTFANKKLTVTTAGTAIQFSTTPVAVDEVYISGSPDFNGWLAVGDSSILASTGVVNGMVIIPGNQPMTIKTNDLKNLWVDSSGDGGVLCISYSAR